MNLLVLFYLGGVAANINDRLILIHYLCVKQVICVLHFNLQFNKLLYINYQFKSVLVSRQLANHRCTLYNDRMMLRPLYEFIQSRIRIFTHFTLDSKL